MIGQRIECYRLARRLKHGATIELQSRVLVAAFVVLARLVDGRRKRNEAIVDAGAVTERVTKTTFDIEQVRARATHPATTPIAEATMSDWILFVLVCSVRWTKRAEQTKHSVAFVPSHLRHGRRNVVQTLLRCVGDWQARPDTERTRRPPGRQSRQQWSQNAKHFASVFFCASQNKRCAAFR